MQGWALVQRTELLPAGCKPLQVFVLREVGKWGEFGGSSLVRTTGFLPEGVGRAGMDFKAQVCSPSPLGPQRTAGLAEAGSSSQLLRAEYYIFRNTVSQLLKHSRHKLIVPETLMVQWLRLHSQWTGPRFSP